MLPLFVVSTLFVVQALSGCDTMSYYAITIFSDLELQPTTVAIIFQVTITLGYLISPMVMVRINTRPQFFVALVVMAVSQVGVGLSLLLPAALSFLSLPCLIL